MPKEGMEFETLFNGNEQVFLYTLRLSDLIVGSNDSLF